MAKLKTITLGKEFKVGLPNYSNLTLYCKMKWEIAEGEEPNVESMWDAVNRELYIQSSGIEPSWLDTKSYKNFFKVEVKIPKTE